MITIESETVINISIQTCFDLARDMDMHVACEIATHERVIAGRVHGKLNLHDTVTFEATHFGIRQCLTSKVIFVDPPHRFIDQVQKSAFKFMRHIHTFSETIGGTLMHDKLILAAPFGPIGWIAERLFLASYMKRFLIKHQSEFKRIAES